MVAMRDQRFVATHRGGSLKRDDQLRLANWAANCAQRVLHLFSAISDDERPTQAIGIGLSWARGEIRTGVAMKASVAAHAAARTVKDRAAVASARAAGHAVATAHFADHCIGALLYALKALEAAGLDSNAELEWQLSQLPDDLRNLVSKNLEARMKLLKIQARIEP